MTTARTPLLVAILDHDPAAICQQTGASEEAALEAVVADEPVQAVPTPERELTTSSAVWLGEREGLKAREAAIVALIFAGMTNLEISGALHMNIQTVKTDIRSAYRKMGVTSRAHAISWGIDHGYQLAAPAARPNDGGQR